MRGSVLPVNKALVRPLLIAGVEKKLAVLNLLLCLPLVAATHFKWPYCFVGGVVFGVLHALLRLVSQYDPHLGKLFKRSTRYSLQCYFPAKSHPSVLGRIRY